MYLQMFILGLTARGLGTCVQMLIAGFPDIVRQALQIPAHYEILCGLAIGYAVEDFPANTLTSHANRSMTQLCSSTSSANQLRQDSIDLNL